MKIQRFMLITFFVFLIGEIPLAAATDGELRTEMIAASRKELLALASAEIPVESLGDWNETIEAAIFILFRRTELYRGNMRILVTDNGSIFARLYPDGTFVLSSGLLDYIDAELYDSASNSPRRVRDFDSEREALPFLVPEAAHFALNHSFSAYKRAIAASGSVLSQAAFGASISPSVDEVLAADSFSSILLALVGYEGAILDNWLTKLETLYEGDLADGAFSVYFNGLPSPEVRWTILTLVDTAC